MSIEPKINGPAIWRFIHFFSIHNIDRNFIIKIQDYLCTECKNEWEDPTDNEDIIEWSLRLHNKVNKKLGKWDKWDINDLNIAHKPECDYCKNIENISQFPWEFIHSISKTENANLLDFLKTFSTLYPCDICKNTFFTDEPLVDETIFNWTIRHHKRFNIARNHPEYIYNDNMDILPSADCQDCSGSSNVTI